MSNPRFFMRPVRTLLRIFFHFLYHQLAFAYDLVAAIVSFGHWKDWTLEALPFIEGTRTLELGPGPGHLQRVLLNRQLDSVAIDESAPMLRLARRNILLDLNQNNATLQSAYAQIKLTRGLAQQLPFRDESFDTIIATFPAEYISDARTLSEVRRCLSDRGRFIVMPVAMPKSRVLSWLFKVTGQASSDALEVIQKKLKGPFVESGFDVDTRVIEKTSGTLIVMIATKKENFYVQNIS